MAPESLMHRIAKMRIHVSDDVKNEPQELEFIMKWNPQINSLKLMKRSILQVEDAVWQLKAKRYSACVLANTNPANMVGAYALAVQKHNMTCSAARLSELSFQC